MQGALTFRRFPIRALVMVLALAAGLILSAAAGYWLKSITAAGASTVTVTRVVPQASGSATVSLPHDESDNSAAATVNLAPDESRHGGIQP